MNGILIRRAPSMPVSIAAGAILSMVLLILLVFSSMVSGDMPELASGTPGIRISDSDTSQEQETLHQPSAVTPTPDMPRMRITPDVDVPMEMPLIKVEYTAAPDIQVGVSVPTPPSFSAANVTAPSFLSAGELDGQPRIMYSPFPNYPPEARRARREGQVMARVTIDTEGRVLSARILPGPDTETFGEATLKAIKRWRFKPGEKFGRKVACEVEIPVVFKLDK